MAFNPETVSQHPPEHLCPPTSGSRLREVFHSVRKLLSTAPTESLEDAADFLEAQLASLNQGITNSTERRNLGSASVLVGTCQCVIGFVEGPNGQWTAQERSDMKDLLKQAQNWLVGQAKVHNRTLEFATTEVAPVLKLDSESALPKLYSEPEKKLSPILDERRLSETLNNAELTGQNVHTLIFCKQRSDSFAMSAIGSDGAKPTQEAAVISSQIVSGESQLAGTIAHEILHLHGAPDIKELSLRLWLHEDVRNSIMYAIEPDINDSRVDPFTARCVGWLDENS